MCIRDRCILDNGSALDISQLSTLIKSSSFVIANDTGPAHMAAHLNIKGLALFGSHASAFLQSIERDNFKSIQVSDLNKLSTEKVSPRKIIEWFGPAEPLSGFGKMILGESFILNGNKEKGIRFIKEGWISAELSKTDLRFYRKKDFALAKKAISEMKKASWTAENKTAKTAKDKYI